MRSASRRSRPPTRTCSFPCRVSFGATRRRSSVPRVDKLLARCRSRGIISFREFEALLKAFGFRLVRVTGSHHMYWHDRASRPLSVQPAGKDAKRYQVRMLLDMIDELGLRLNDDR